MKIEFLELFKLELHEIGVCLVALHSCLEDLELMESLTEGGVEFAIFFEQLLVGGKSVDYIELKIGRCEKLVLML